MAPTQTLPELAGRTVFDCHHSKVGAAGDVYVDGETGQPEWLAVRAGLFGTYVHFVPLDGLQRHADGVVVPYTVSHVKNAPKADGGGPLDPDTEHDLCEHYGLRSG